MTKPTIAVCGTIGKRVDETVGIVASSARFAAVPVRWPDAAALAAARGVAPGGPDGWLLLGPRDPSLVDLACEIARGTPWAPIVWLGTPMPAAMLVDCLGGLVAQDRSALPEAADATRPPSRTWRRKSDMIIGTSKAITQLMAALDRLAGSVASVLITGESGTGKELVARALHYTGPRASAPFIAINCGAIPEALFEAELFGYQRGAFTGAVSNHQGAFEAADGGTLFLDEIGDMPLALQVKLLRVLEAGEVTRLGSNDKRRSNVRLVAATNRNLEAEVRADRFREDLFYRVSVYPVRIPPLRERPEDIPALVTHHLEQIARREQRAPARMTPAALQKLMSHRWPGNVRELVNALERALLLAERDVIDAEHLLLPEERAPVISAYRDAKERFEHDYYAQLLRTAGGNISFAAKLAQKTRKEVYDALRKLGLHAGVYRESSGTMRAVAPVEAERESEEQS